MRRRLLKLLLKLFKLPISSVSLRNKGLIIISLDGLSFKVLNEAIKRGYCPYLKRCIKQGIYKLNDYYACLPTTTTSIEAELLYGNSDKISGFSYIDRKRKAFVNGYDGGEIRRVEEELAGISKSLITDGSCIIGMYKGDAKMSSFTTGDLVVRNPLTVLVKLRLIFLLFLHPNRFWGTLFLFLRQIFVGMYLLFLNRSFKVFIESCLDFFIEVFTNSVACDVARIELLRETPRLFVNFSLYDHLAHLHGVRSPIAYSSLKVLDSYCQMLLESAKRSSRSYDSIVLSDHGQSESIWFETIKGESLKDYLVRILKDDIKRVEVGTFFLNRKITTNTLYVLLSCDIAHLYFSDYLKSTLTHVQINQIFPNLIDNLISHPAIGWVLTRRDKNSQVLISKRGSIVMSKGVITQKTGDVLNGIFDSAIDVEIARFAQKVNNGDIVLFGDVLLGKTVSFEPFNGAHGGFTGPMIKPFIMSNNGLLNDFIVKDKTMKNIFGKVRIIYPPLRNA